MVTCSFDFTKKFRRYATGDREVAEARVREMLPRLHQIAARALKRERHIGSLEPTELVNEMWLRNHRKGGWRMESREHFYSIAGRSMRRVLVDFARNRLAQRRGGGAIPASIEDIQIADASPVGKLESMLHIGDLMARLMRAHPDCARVVDLHYFAGFTFEEIAGELPLSLRQVRLRWEKGRDWLKLRI